MDPHSIEFLDPDPPVRFQILKSHIQNFEPIFIYLFNFIFSSKLMRITFTCAWLQII
jgi:hypothetical protein